MAKSKPTGREVVHSFYEKLEHPLKDVMVSLHRIIMETDAEIGEHIKWNAPAFYYTGNMPAFDAKTYQRDLVVFNLHKKEYILLVFPTGARIQDPSGFLEGTYPDGRKTAIIRSAADLMHKAADLRAVIRNWLDTIEK